MKNKINPLSLITLFAFLASCGGKDQQPTDDSRSPVTVSVAKAGEDNPEHYFSVSGTLEAKNSANLSTRMMGFVDHLAVKVGDQVTQGQLLVALKNTEFQAKKAQASANSSATEAAYANAQKDLERYQNLFAENSISPKEMEDMTTRYTMAKANWDAAREMEREVTGQFAYVQLRAPFAGTITNTFVEKGDMAQPGVPLVALEAPGQYEVSTLVPETAISKIAPNTQAMVYVKALDTLLPARILEVGSSSKNTAGQYPVKVGVQPSKAAVLSGMFSSVRFAIEGTPGQDQVWIPKSALVHHGQLSGIYTISQANTAMLRWLRLGKEQGARVEVLSGLASGEQYILEADGKLFNGAPIKVQ